MRDKYGLSETEYERIKKAMARSGFRIRHREFKPEDEFDRQAKDDERAFWKTLWKQVHDTAMQILTKRSPQIMELGYIHEDEHGNAMPDFVKFLNDAIDFYLKEGSRVQELESENKALKASVELLSILYKEALHRLNEARATVVLTELVNQDNEAIPIILSPIKERLGVS